MKHSTVFCAMLLLVAFATASQGQGITGSKHDFSSASWNGSGQICKPCHTPHDAMTGLEPLWNHALSTATYTTYSSATMNATVGTPDGSSKLCLSCHDGTVALENFSGRTNGTNMLSGTDNLGTALSNDHPVSFTYDGSLATADGGLKTPTSTSFVDAGSTVPLFNGKMQCATCHDVHNSQNISKLLVKSNASSALCLSCHNK
jgi:predicted CXXCH cytochrome family protein